MARCPPEADLGMAKSDKHLTATRAQGWPRVDSHPSNRQKSQEDKMDEGNEQSFRKCVRHLFGERAGQRRTALLQKRAVIRAMAPDFNLTL